MKKVTMCVISVIVALALVLVPVTSTPAIAADDSDVVARFTFNDEVYEYETLEGAIADAEQVGGITIYLVADYTLPADLVIPSNVTVTLPTSGNYDDTFGGSDNAHNNGQTGTPYVTLTIPENVTLGVEGVLLVAGNQQSTVPRSGYLTGNYGAINLEGNLNVYGVLYARGEINGSGTTTVYAGGEVYERFEIADWRGGNASLAAYTGTNGVYPFNLYQVSGLNVSTTYMSGSHLYGQAYIYSAQLNKDAVSVVNVIGPEAADAEHSALITFDNDATTIHFADDENGVSVATINGSVSTGDISVDINVFGIEFPLTAEGVGPFGYMQDLVLSEGSTFNVDNELKILPGCTITVQSGATLNASGRLYLYTADAYSSTYNRANWTSASDAVVEVEEGGALTGNIGSTSETFDNVHGVTLTAGEEKETVWEVTQSGIDVTFVGVEFTMHLTPATDA